MSGAAPSRSAVLQIACCLVAVAVAVLPYRAYFASTGFVVPLLAATVAGAAVAAVARTRRWRPWVTAVAAVAGYAVVMLAVVLPEPLTRAGVWATLSQLVTGTFGGWAVNLSTGLPATPTGAVLFAPCLVQWFGACAAVVALRSPAVAAPILPMIGPFLISVLVVAGRPGSNLFSAMVVLGTAAGLLLLRSGAVGGPARGTATCAVVTAVLVAMTAAIAVTGWPSSGARRFDVRTVRSLPVATRPLVTPLSAVQNLALTGEAVPQFAVRFGAGRPVTRIQVAVLSDFDGAVWTSAGRFRLTDRHLAAGPDPMPTATVSARITVAELSGPTDTNFFARADMADTKVGAADKDDAARVAKQGFDALMNGADQVVAGSLKNKLQAVAGKVVPDRVKAQQHRRMAEPGSADN